MLSDPNDAAIVHTIIRLPPQPGLDVIAEGWKPKSKRISLGEAGCDLYQGYLFSKPLPVADLEAFLTQALEGLSVLFGTLCRFSPPRPQLCLLGRARTCSSSSSPAKACAHCAIAAPPPSR